MAGSFRKYWLWFGSCRWAARQARAARRCDRPGEGPDAPASRAVRACRRPAGDRRGAGGARGHRQDRRAVPAPGRVRARRGDVRARAARRGRAQRPRDRPPRKRRPEVRRRLGAVRPAAGSGVRRSWRRGSRRAQGMCGSRWGSAERSPWRSRYGWLFGTARSASAHHALPTTRAWVCLLVVYALFGDGLLRVGALGRTRWPLGAVARGRARSLARRRARDVVRAAVLRGGTAAAVAQPGLAEFTAAVRPLLLGVVALFLCALGALLRGRRGRYGVLGVLRSRSARRTAAARPAALLVRLPAGAPADAGRRGRGGGGLARLRVRGPPARLRVAGDPGGGCGPSLGPGHRPRSRVRRRARGLRACLRSQSPAACAGRVLPAPCAPHRRATARARP